MTATPCERCERPVGDAHVCSLCGRDAERALGNVPALIGDLELTLSRQRRFVETSDGGRAAETPVPFHVHAGEAGDVLRNVLVSWCKFYAEECGADLPSAPADDRLRQAQVTSRYLIRRVEWFRHHELANDFVDEVVSAVGAVARIIDAPTNRTTFAVGPCPEVDAIKMPCPGEVRAFIPASEATAARMECSVDREHVWATWQWLRAGERILRRQEQTT